METHILKTPELTAHAFAKQLCTKSKEVNRLNIALSGGSTPRLLFDILAAKYALEIEWSKLHFYWGDERCVPPTDDESNYKMTNEHLFSKLEIDQTNIHRILGEENPAKEAARYGQLIADNLPSFNGLPQFDIVLLGLGEDGHTASIFPDQMELLDDKSVCSVATHPVSGQKRVSLTGPMINNAKEVSFLVTGAGKAEKVGEIFNQDVDYLKYPASHIQPPHGLVDWYLDKAAAANIR